MEYWFRVRWSNIEKDLAHSRYRNLISPIFYGHHKITLPLLLKYAKGTLIDLGCGYLPYKNFLSGKVQKYDSLDLYPRTTDVTYTGDIQDMRMVDENFYDTALCLEVLEHVADPFRACREISRILKSGGNLILSVPHLSRMHDEPHDYYRFTNYGIQVILGQAGFTILEIQDRGGLFSFIGHQISTALLSLTWRIPILEQIAWLLNSWFITRLCFFLDTNIIPNRIFAQGYSVVAKKPDILLGQYERI